MNPFFLNQVNRKTLPQHIFSVLPFTLFFPVGVIYTGIFLFFLAWLASGQYCAKWQVVRSHPLFIPVVTVSSVVVLVASIMGIRSEEFWSSFLHYQIYWIVLLLVSVGNGPWRRRAVLSFFVGAVYAATLYYLVGANVLPHSQPFYSYYYVHGKSISLCIVLAVAAAWMFFEFLHEAEVRRRVMRGLIFLYVSGGLMYFSGARTGHVIFVALMVGLLCYSMRLSVRKGMVYSMIVISGLATVWYTSPVFQKRTAETTQDAQSCTVGVTGTSTCIRMELYRITFSIAKEKPFFGQGVGTWLPIYRERSVGLSSHEMLTPHNEYLLYAAEMGGLGLLALLFVWCSQLWLACKTAGYDGVVLGLLTVAMMIAGSFNAILRDAVYGVPFMVLLAIPFAGLKPRT